MDNTTSNTTGCQGGQCGTADQTPAEQAVATEATPAKKNESGRSYVPAVDIVDRGEQTLLVIDMPGVADSDVELTLEKNILTIEASPAIPSFEGKDLVYSEYGVGDFKRSFSLTEDIDRDSITAHLADGILTVTMKKLAPVTKKITVGS